MASSQQPPPPPLPPFDPNNSQIYPASCHCGTVQYTVQLSPPLPDWKVVSCNCSICTRNGYLLVYPSRAHLQLTSGSEALKDYVFGRKRNLHKFCARCGSAVWFDPRMVEFGEGGGLDLLGVNVRMFKGVKTKDLDIVYVEDRYPDVGEGQEQS